MTIGVARTASDEVVGKTAHQAQSSGNQGCIKAVLRTYKALLRLYYSIKGLLRLYEGSIKGY
jgi:hypothetical protein